MAGRDVGCVGLSIDIPLLDGAFGRRRSDPLKDATPAFGWSRHRFFAIRIARLAELLHVETKLPGFVVFLELVPGDLAPGVGGFAAEDAGAVGFHAGGDLVVVLAAGDALDETAVLVAIGVNKVVGEGAVGGKFRGLGGFLLLAFGIDPGPGVFAEDAERAGVGHFGQAVRAVDALGDVEAEVAELGGRKADVDVSLG
jgi:hypothetical protein